MPLTNQSPIADRRAFLVTLLPVWPAAPELAANLSRDTAVRNAIASWEGDVTTTRALLNAVIDQSYDRSVTNEDVAPLCDDGAFQTALGQVLELDGKRDPWPPLGIVRRTSPIATRRAELRRYLRPGQDVPEIEQWTGDVDTTTNLIHALINRHATSQITATVLIPLCGDDTDPVTGSYGFIAALERVLRAGVRNPWPIPVDLSDGNGTQGKAPAPASVEAAHTVIFHDPSRIEGGRLTDALRDFITGQVNLIGRSGEQYIDGLKSSPQGRALLRSWEAATGLKVGGL